MIMEEKMFELMTKMYNEMKQGFDGVEKRFDNVENRLDKIEQRLDNVEEKINRLEGAVNRNIEEHKGMLELIQSIETKVDDLSDDFNGIERITINNWKYINNLKAKK